MQRKLRKILLVDDNPVSQRLSERMFQNDGYQVILAWDEKTCLVEALRHGPDAVLMDIIFPNDDGRDIVKKLKANPALADIPIIFASNTFDVLVDKGDETIMVDGVSYRSFAKPLHYPKLLSVVRKEINRHQHKLD